MYYLIGRTHSINQNKENWAKFDSWNETDNLITLVFNNKLKNCCSMFSGCSDIYEMDFSNFDITEVTYMNSMFSGCSSLISLNLFNFGNSEVKCTCNMFNGCTNLNYINLGNFNETTIL